MEGLSNRRAFGVCGVVVMAGIRKPLQQENKKNTDDRSVCVLFGIRGQGYTLLTKKNVKKINSVRSSRMRRCSTVATRGARVITLINA
jgi:hypothetical protein